MIPENISKESVLNALDDIRKDGIPQDRHSDKYYLLHDSFLYPPKYVLTIANKFVNSKELDSTEFSGGPESNEFLEKLGFTLVRKPSDLSGQKWLAVVTPENWEICLQNGTFGGDDNRANQIKRIKLGDHVLFYLTGMKIAAICRVVKEYFYDDKKIVSDGVYPHRFGIEPIKIPKNPIDIKSLYDIYLKYKGAAGGYFGQTIRPLSDEEFSIFQSELARSMGELTDWNKPIIANSSNTGEEEGQEGYAEILKTYLETRYSINIERVDRSGLRLPSGIIINARGSGNRSEIQDQELFWFGLDRNVLDKHLQYPNTYFALVAEKPTRTYVFSKNEFLNFIENVEPGKRPKTGNDRWLIKIHLKDGKAELRINRSDKSHEVNQFLNNWKQIPDFHNSNDLPSVFVTGYDDANLSHSIRYKTLGWRNESHLLSTGDYVFVYNKDSHKIQAAFNVVGKSDNKKPIWEEELRSEAQKIEFPNRWNAEVLRDDLNIDLDTINTFEPFNGNAVRKFIPLIGNNSPTPLSDDKYFKFNEFLLERCGTLDSRAKKERPQIRYWKIVPGENASVWQEQLTNGVVAIGWDKLGDLSNRDIDSISDEIKKKWEKSYYSIVPQIRDFISIREGDIIIANKGFSKVVGIGRVTGGYKYRPNHSYPHTYPVEWFDTTEREIRPQIGAWRRTIDEIGQSLYDEIIGKTSNVCLLLRHQPDYKRKKSEREYWNDRLGTEYHFGKNVVNYKKLRPGAKTIWFYSDKDKFYFWGYGQVDGVIDTANDEFIATYKDFNLFGKKSALEGKQLTQNKIKSLDSWNPYNSIIEIGEEIYNEILEDSRQIDEFEDAALEFPSQSQIDTAVDKISQNLLVSKKIIMQVIISILSGKNVILAGPVGTGKTTLAKLIGELFWYTDDYDGYYSGIYTATAEWSSHDIIGGIVPRIRNNEPTYDIVMGCVSETVLDNWSNSRKARVPTIKDERKFKGTWLIIDEFNRADIDKVFGQLFTSLETRTLKVPVIEGSKSFEEVRIPLDYRIICTLNTADKHYLFKLSDALKRRFAYIELFPPDRQEREREIYYALKNGLKELAYDFSNQLVLDSGNKTVDLDRTNKEMMAVINHAYDIFDVTRMVKPLGTAILKSIYQSLLVGVKLTNNYDESLDASINSNLVPQLESMNVPSLESIFYFLFRDPVAFFRKKHEGVDRDQYQNDFKNFLRFISVKKQDEWSAQFLEKIDEPVWVSITDTYSQRRMNIKCPLFRNSLQDLVRASLV